MAATRMLVSDVLCADEATSTSRNSCPSSPVLASKDVVCDDEPSTEFIPTGMLSPKTSSSSLNSSIKRTRPSASSNKRQREDEDDDDDEVTSVPAKRTRITSTCLPTPNESRCSSMNMSNNTSHSRATIPRSFADIESALAPIADLATEEEKASEESTTNPLESLPLSIMSIITNNLDYRSLISLSSTSRHLRKSVNPQSAPFDDKFAFVMRAESFFPQHWPRETDDEEHPGNFACFVCFRVRGPDRFDDNQRDDVCVRDDNSLPFQVCTSRVHSTPNCHSSKVSCQSPDDFETKQNPYKTKLVTLRRYCIDCGVKHGLHKPGDVITCKDDQLSWICNCRQVCSSAELKCSQCNDPRPAELSQWESYMTKDC